jgi:hypothetical protein
MATRAVVFPSGAAAPGSNPASPASGGTPSSVAEGRDTTSPTDALAPASGSALATPPDNPASPGQASAAITA